MNDELRKRLDDFRKRQASTANANAGIEAERARRKAAAAKAAATRAASTMAKAKAAREAAAAAAVGAAGGGAGPGPASALPPGSTRDSLRTARRAVGVPLAKQLKVCDKTEMERRKRGGGFWVLLLNLINHQSSPALSSLH